VGKNVAVLVKDKQRQYEGLRSSLGLLLEDHQVSMFVLDHEIELTEEYEDNMMFIDEMGGARYSNVNENVAKYGFQHISLEKIVSLLNENEIIIPY
jgi:hypothetical protein